MADSPDLPPPPANQELRELDSTPLSRLPVVPAHVVPEPRRSDLGSGLRALWTLVVRLVLLGVGVSAGWLAGMLVAQIFPANNPEPPLAEVALRRSSQSGRKLQQLPQWWRNDSEDAVVAGAPAPEVPSAQGEAVVTAPEAEPSPLSEGDRDRIRTDLTQARQDLVELSTRLSELETALGT
ncbi:MAG: hypothetical protein WBG38_04705, partial [Nodosilinea sp.]